MNIAVAAVAVLHFGFLFSCLIFLEIAVLRPSPPMVDGLVNGWIDSGV